jgi:carboxymethylenebutenolidase
MRIALVVIAGMSIASLAAAAPKPQSLPPSDSLALERLDSSPRHGEFVDIPYGTEGVPLRTWVVYPERKDKAGVVLLIHEIFGLSKWMRGLADQVAADGFIAVAPDLISGMGPGGGGTDSVATRDDVVKLIRGLSAEETNARLAAVRAWAMKLPSANGKIASMGFCWGGGRSFELAASDPPPQASVVFYGVAPDSATLMRVRAPVLGLYGGDDARVDATIEPAKAVLKAAKASYEPHIFEGAGHGFLRQQEGRDGANRAATEKAWPRVVSFLKAHLK